METDNLWKHLWPASLILCEFISTNPKLWSRKCILEIGAGATALPSLTALCFDAEKVFISDQSRLKTAFEYIAKNVDKNFEETNYRNRVTIMGLDWGNRESIREFLRQPQLNQLDYIFGSDVFFDPSVFKNLLLTLRLLFDVYPGAEFFFTYQIRDSDWSIEDLLVLNRLKCVPIRLVNTEKHSFYLGKIFSLRSPQKTNNEIENSIKRPKMSEISAKSENSNNVQILNENLIIFGGIEGGATRSAFTLIGYCSESSRAEILGCWSNGPPLNCLLNGVEKTADQIASWMRSAIETIRQKIHLPINSLGMGLAGAENSTTNRSIVEYFQRQHGDLASTFFLTSDSVAAVATAFDKGGVVLIAGTGSACRLLKYDGTIHGVGGWGHIIGDGGGAIWISTKAIQKIFDIDDGLTFSNSSPENAKQEMCRHFNISDKLALLDILYGKFDKALIASFTISLAKLAETDEFSKEIFNEAGKILGKHLLAISRHFDTEMYNDVPVLLIGSVFKSWHLIKNGFEEVVRNPEAHHAVSSKNIQRISFYQLSESTAFGAAFMAARFANQINTSNKMKKDSVGNLNAEKIEEIFGEICNKNRIFFDSI